MSAIISVINKIPIGHPAERGFFLYSHIPASVLQKIAAENFRKTVAYVYGHSKFYRREFDARGIRPEEVKRPEDLGDFFTTAEDIREFPDDFICLKPDTAFETTGTTSKKPKRVYFSREEIREAGWAGAVGLWGLGVRPGDRIASAFDNSFWVSGPVLSASCEALGAFHVEAGHLDPEEFYDRVKDYGITVIVGDPSWVVRLSEAAEKKGAWPVKLLLAGGENLTEESRRYVEGVWKADFLLEYGQTEAFGAIGMEWRDKDGYYLNEFHNAFEIIRPDAEGCGELVYTTLNRRVMPLVRYRSGDLTRFIERESKAGLPVRRIEKLKGRVDEWTVTSMGNIAPWMFESLFRSVEGIGEDWQIVVQKEGNKDRIEFHLETPNGMTEARAKEKVLEEMKVQMAPAWKIYGMGTVIFDFLLHPKGSLRTERKLKRIVDRRRF